MNCTYTDVGGHAMKKLQTNNMLKEFIKLYTQEKSNYNYEIFTKLYDVRVKLRNLDYLCNNLGQILDFERYVINHKGVNRFSIEEKVLELLQMLVIDIFERFNFGNVMLNEELIENTQNNELKKAHKINLNLLVFANELFNISIPRDSFSSRRKGLALGIISRLLIRYDFPNKFDLFMEAIKSSKDKVIIEALNELHYYYEYFPKKHLPSAMITELDRIILKTKNKSVATRALNLQVITGNISEVEALSRIDDWKEKYYYS